ncbi:hypothetical protein RQP46_005246 [Phenoliferia psychrophenolica]
MTTLSTAVKAEPQPASVVALAPTTSSSLSQLPRPESEPLQPLGATTTSSSLAPTPSGPLPPPSERRVAASDSPAEDEEDKAKLELKREDQADLASRDQRESGMEPTDEKEEAGASLGIASDSEATAVDASTAATSPASEEMDVEEDVKPTAPLPSAKPETRSKRQKRGGEAEAEEEVDIKPKQDPEDLADRDRRLELAHFPRVDRPSTGGSLLSISIFADSFFSTYPPDQPPKDLHTLKHFKRKDLGGAPQATYSQGGDGSETTARPFASARLTLDPKRNFCLKKAGGPFLSFTGGEGGRIVNTSVFVLDPEGAKRDDPSPGWPYMDERWGCLGTYRNLWVGSLTQQDWDWAMMPAGFDEATATAEEREAESQREAFVDAMAEYGDVQDDPRKYSINQVTLEAWNFSVTSICGPREDRMRSIRDEMDNHTESIKVGWALYVYAGYDQAELDWVGERRRVRRATPVVAKAPAKTKKGKSFKTGKGKMVKGKGKGKGRVIQGKLMKGKKA